jgi:hypothetical protein
MATACLLPTSPCLFIFPCPPQRGRDLDSKASKQAGFITCSFLDTPRTFVKWKSRSAPALSTYLFLQHGPDLNFSYFLSILHLNGFIPI